VKLLNLKLSPFGAPVPAEQVKRQLTALGSGREGLIKQAKEKLVQMGPGVVPILHQEMDAADWGEAKRTIVARLAFDLHRQHRRATMLRAQLRTTDAAALLKRLAKASASHSAASFFDEAVRYRENVD
jgi:hypothetical protein